MTSILKTVTIFCNDIAVPGIEQHKDGVQLYYCLNSSTEVLEGLETFLTPAEQARSEKFYFETDRRTYKSAHAYLNIQLASILNCNISDLPFSIYGNGKPYLQNCDIYFNISHSRNSWVIAISKNPVGVDMEYLKKLNYSDIIANYFTPAEQFKVTNSQTPVIDFYKIWTRKEAYLKFSGIGINVNLQQLAVGEESNLNTSIISSPLSSVCYIDTLVFPEHIVSVARKNESPVQVEEITKVKFMEKLEQLETETLTQPLQSKTIFEET